MKLTARMCMGLVVALLLAIPAMAAESLSADIPSEVILIKNVNVFDGINEALIENANVLVEGNLIAAVSTDPIDADGATVIDGNGGTLIPIVTAPSASSRKAHTPT